MSSRLPGFHALPLPERRRILARLGNLSDDDVRALDGINVADVEALSENVIGVYGGPLALATNFVVNGREFLVPMVTEESSVVAAASHGAKLARRRGWFRATATEPIMIGQILVVDVDDARAAAARVLDAADTVLEAARDALVGLEKRGGGARSIEARPLHTPDGPAVAVHILIDVRDAMGANAVNAACEAAAPAVARAAGGRALLRILSNLADRRLVRTEATFEREGLGGARVVKDIVLATHLAMVDPYRAATHNKGVMNGVDAVVVATGNDWRAVEAGAHAWAARGGYHSLTEFEETPQGDLRGVLEMPLALGTVGGATRVHAGARTALKILGNPPATDLACVAVS
ncbi:MAG TPA: hydroxymethylglutaryl-CoA reductase, degradative, partial [Candidatus Thermoplasmatota archaeon]|nr:hydroxymethylglutaryl-CoA reductase, degradative [Candidatus Thermoplasmatota archaeon]